MTPNVVHENYPKFEKYKYRCFDGAPTCFCKFSKKLLHNWMDVSDGCEWEIIIIILNVVITANFFK